MSVLHSIEHVLVGVDLHHGDRLATRDPAPETLAAITQAIKVAQAARAKITFCAVLEVGPQAESRLEDAHRQMLKTVEDVAAAALQKQIDRAVAAGIVADGVVLLGEAWEELIKVALERKSSLLVLGTRNRSAATRSLFGSTANKLIRYCPCPLWITKPGELREILEIGVATDLGDTADEVLEAGVAVARTLQARLFVVHAIEFPLLGYMQTAGLKEAEENRYREAERAKSERRFRELLEATDYRTLQHGVKFEMIEGLAEEVVPPFVEKNGIDVVVLGTHARTGLSGFLLGNTAERLLPELHSSVLTVKPREFVSPIQLDAQ